MKKKSTKNSSQRNYKKYFDNRMGKGAPEKLKNAVLQHPDDTDDSIYGYMQKNKSRNMWVMNFDQYKKAGGVSESLNEDEWTDDILDNLGKESNEDWWTEKNSEELNMHSLERDLMKLVNKYSGKIGIDSYGSIDAIYKILDGMFERVEK